MRGLPISLAIKTLRGEMPQWERRAISKDMAAEWLRAVSGEDFGLEPDAWTEWLKKNRWAYYRSPFSHEARKGSSGNTAIPAPEE